MYMDSLGWYDLFENRMEQQYDLSKLNRMASVMKKVQPNVKPCPTCEDYTVGVGMFAQLQNDNSELNDQLNVNWTLLLITPWREGPSKCGRIHQYTILRPVSVLLQN